MSAGGPAGVHGLFCQRLQVVVFFFLENVNEIVFEFALEVRHSFWWLYITSIQIFLALFFRYNTL